MKCGNFVKWGTRRRKGSGEEYQKALDVKSRMHFRDRPEMVEGYEICDGEVACTKLRAVDEPDWGGTTAVLEFELKCNKCGTTFHPEVAETPEDLVSLINRGLAYITEDIHEILRTNWWGRYTERYGERPANT